MKTVQAAVLSDENIKNNLFSRFLYYTVNFKESAEVESPKTATE